MHVYSYRFDIQKYTFTRLCLCVRVRNFFYIWKINKVFYIVWEWVCLCTYMYARVCVLFRIQHTYI